MAAERVRAKGGAKTAKTARAAAKPTGVDRRAEEMAILNDLRRLVRLLRLNAVEIQTAAGVSAAQLYILRQLAADKDGASISELAEQTLTDRSSVASVVDRLVAAGLAERHVSAEDRRRAEIWITRAGQKIVAKAPAPPTASMIAALDTFSDAELTGLSRGLTALVHEMGLDKAPPQMFFEEGDGNGKQVRKPRRRT